MANKSQEKEFDGTIRYLEGYEFQEFAEEDVYIPTQNKYAYFAPSWHFRHELLTQELVNDIRKNKRQVLSVGSGAGYLERFLVKILGVKMEQITLSDKHQVMPEGFERFTFDMYGKWPDFGKQFDYVLFPESALLNVWPEQGLQRPEELYHLIENSLVAMNRFGQMRINGHSQSEESAATVGRWLKRYYPSSKLTYNPNLIVVKSGCKAKALLQSSDQYVANLLF